MKAFLNKFVAALCLHRVESIPFAGKEFQDGVGVVENYLKNHLTEDNFNKISDVFAKVPVEENYQQIRGLFMDLNGYGISFSGADNPRWKTMTIKMKPYLAERTLNDATVFDIDRELMCDAAKEFCEVAGVPLWGVY